MKTMHQKPSCKVEDNAYDDIWQEANGGLDGRKFLDFLEAFSQLAKVRKEVGVTHKRLRIVSVPFNTAQARRTIKQIEANAVFFHRELGIKADFPFFSLQFIQPMNAGIQAAAMHSKAMFSKWWMLAGLSVMTLCLKLAIVPLGHNNSAYAKT